MHLLDKYRNWRLRKHVEKFGSKNNGYFNYFNREWFEEHQTTLIFLLNHWLLKYWFRWILRIHKDCKFNEVIDKIEPHTYRIKVGENEYRSDFRTHQKFSKRIYYAFRPYWYLLHALDFVIQRTVNPEFSFGFDTLTAYPEADTASVACDGYVQRTNYDGETVDLIIAGSGTDKVSNSGIDYLVQAQVNTSTQDMFVILQRAIFQIDTSALGSGATISGAVFSFFRQTYVSDPGNINPSLSLVSTAPTSPTALAANDYNVAKWGTTKFATDMTKLAWETGYGTYGDLTLNTAGKAAISKTGVTKLGVRFAEDVNGYMMWWSSGSAVLAFTTRYADNTGTTYDPRLVVTYTLPATFIPQIIMS